MALRESKSSLYPNDWVSGITNNPAVSFVEIAGFFRFSKGKEMDYAGYRPSWLKRVRRSLRDCKPKIALGLLSFEDGFCFELFGFIIALPFLDRWHREPEEMMDRWGFYFYEWTSLWLVWGKRQKVIHFPWEYTHIKTQARLADGTFVKRVQSYDRGEPDGREYQSFDYRYVMKSGEVQNRTATCHVIRMEWRQKWLRWTSLFAKIRTSLEIEFSDEVGEESGSWKGGCVGCGYDMKPNETMEQTLRRMESERKFN